MFRVFVESLRLTVALVYTLEVINRSLASSFLFSLTCGLREFIGNYDEYFEALLYDLVHRCQNQNFPKASA